MKREELELPIERAAEALWKFLEKPPNGANFCEDLDADQQQHYLDAAQQAVTEYTRAIQRDLGAPPDWD